MHLKPHKLILSFIKETELLKQQYTDNSEIDTKLPIEERCNTKKIILLSTEDVKISCFDIERWSSFDKALKIIAWIFRFIHNVCPSENEKKTGELTIEELTMAKHKILINIQKQDYPSELESLKKGMTG